MTDQLTEPAVESPQGERHGRVIRLAHLLDGRHFGGAEQMVRRLVEASPRIGVEAWVYCLSEGRLADFLRAEGVPLRLFASRGRFDLRMLGAMAAAAREDGIDILQAHTSRTHLLARLLSRRMGLPNITTIHSPIGQDENRARRRHPLRAWIERLGRPWTTHIVCVSQEECERIISQENVSPAKISWIPNGVDPAADPLAVRSRARRRLAGWLQAHGIDSQDFTVVMVAQLRPRKGPEILLRAFAQWRKQGGRGILLLVGDDEFTDGKGYLHALREMAASLGIAACTRFTGFLAQPWDLAAGADLVVLPSLFGEGMPLVLLEAMKLGLPIAVSDTAGNREMAAGGNGWLHPPGDAATLARQIAEAAAQPAERQARGRAGLELFLREYTLGQMLGRYRALYDRLHGATGSPATGDAPPPQPL